MARSLHPSRLIALAALAAVVLAWFLPRPVPARGSDTTVVHRTFQGADIGGSAVAGFALKIDSATNRQTGNPYTSVCCDTEAYLAELWGTYMGGDSFTGTVKSGPLPVTSSYWYLPITGYPSRQGNRLYIEVVGANGTAIKRSTYHGTNPGEALGLWRVDLRGFQGGTARVFLEDGTTNPTGWLGVGAPIATERSAATLEDLLKGPTNYARYWLSGLVLAALIFIPGLAIRRWRSNRFARAVGDPAPPSLEPLLLPIPGLMVLALYGIMLWLLDAGHNGLARHILLIIEAGLAGWSATSGRAGSDREPGPPNAKKNSERGQARPEVALHLGTRSSSLPALRSLGEGGETTRATSEGYSHYWVWGIYLGVVILTAGYGIIRRPVTQEFFRGTSFQSRMVASPPDSIIPYTTAAYFQAGYDGVAHSKAYFGDATVTTRGPLAPWIINAAFNVLRLRPRDPPNSTTDAWPATADGYYAARWIAVLTNACAIAGVAALTLALGGRLWFAAIWAAVAPVTFINVSFAWPKLFAAYFILIALAECLRGKPAYRWGLWIVLAYLAHPVGGLFAVPLLIYAMRTRGLKSAILAGAMAGLCLLPWLAYKHSLGVPDAFWRYTLSDGRGDLPALSATSWLVARWRNLWFTVVPCAYFFSPEMHVWLWGPVSQPARWAVQYAKTLPSNLGFYGAALTYFALVRLAWAKGRAQTSPEARRFALWFFLPCLLVLLVYAGFAADGLGRNCLEPLSMAVIAWSAAACSLKLRPSALMLGFVAIETMTMVVFGFL